MNTGLDDTMTILCYGNPARGDDGLGPELARRLDAIAPHNVRVESDYQLFVEDAADISESSLVLFVDAAVAGPEPFSLRQVEERNDLGYLAHSIDPGRLLGLTRATFGRCPPACALAIRGYSFDMFTEGLTDRAAGNLEEAFRFLSRLLSEPNARQQILASALSEPTPSTTRHWTSVMSGSASQEA